MDKQNRRKFIKDIALAGGALTVGLNTLNALTFFPQQGKKKTVMVQPAVASETPQPIDFRYSPSSWQSTFCLPDDAIKSLVGKNGELLYGHPGLLADIDAFAQKVWFGVSGAMKGEYIGQKLEHPAVPIVTTRLKFPDMLMTLTTFASNYKNEGRVDNVIMEIVPDGKTEVECLPVLTIVTKSHIEADEQDDDLSTLLMGDEDKALFVAVDNMLELKTDGDTHSCNLLKKTITADSPYRAFFRFPQAKQELDVIEDGMEEAQNILTGARNFWQGWKPFEGNISWQIPEKEQEFLVSSARNILQSRAIKDGKKAFQVGPTVYRGLWVVDGVFILEAARYMGYDKEAQEGLETIWNLQTSEGGIFAGGGESHWKDTAAALYMLIRQAELSQNWDYFQELWPDMHKAAMYLRNIRFKAYNNGTANGNYALMPQGFGDSGIGGIRSEFTNTLWTLIAIKKMMDTSNRISVLNKVPIKDFFRELWLAFLNASKAEMRTHPTGFKYLPMLMKEDSKWNDPNPLNRPKEQAAQVYLSHAIYPGLLFGQEVEIVKGHIALMKAIMKEDVPAETGWLAHDAVWPYNAPIAAQVFLWLNQPLMARKLFHGFLNHASPMYSWREEQTLRGLPDERFIGDMPHNWASAECIRYLRHCFVLEDDKNLRLFDGIIEDDLKEKRTFSFTYTPTRWGRVTVSLEPLADDAWKAKFKRENFDTATMPNLQYIEFNRKLSPKLQLDTVVGKDVKYYKQGGRVLVEPNCLEWEAVWREFKRKTK